MDQIARVLALVGYSMPIFWLGLLLSYFFAVRLGWLPPSARLGNETVLEPVTGFYVLDALLRGQPAAAWDALRHLILPAIALGTIPLAIIARITRSSLLEVLGQDYVRTARAKGLSERVVVLKHVLRNSLIPVITVIALSLPAVFGGAIITEQVFKVNGLGQQLITSIYANDLPMVMTLTFIFAILIVVFTLIADVLYGILDPRIRYD